MDNKFFVEKNEVFPECRGNGPIIMSRMYREHLYDLLQCLNHLVQMLMF